MTDLPPLACSVCHDEYGTASALAAHQRRAHIDRVMHACQRCGAGFLTPAELQLHEVTVHIDVSSPGAAHHRMLGSHRRSDSPACLAVESDDNDGDAVGFEEDGGEDDSGDDNAVDSDSSTTAGAAVADAGEEASESPVFSIRHSEGLKLRIRKIAHSSGDTGSCTSPEARSPSLGSVHRFDVCRETSSPSQLHRRHIGPLSPTSVIAGGLLRPPVLDAAKLIAGSRTLLPAAPGGFGRGDAGSNSSAIRVDSALAGSPARRPVNGSVDRLTATATTPAFPNGHSSVHAASPAGVGSSGGARLQSPSTVDALSSPRSSSSPPGKPQLIRPPTFRPPSAKPAVLSASALQTQARCDDSGSLIKKPKLVLGDGSPAAAADGSRGLQSFQRLLLGSTTGPFSSGSSSSNGGRNGLRAALARHPAFGSDAVPLLSPKPSLLADPVLSRLLSVPSRPAVFPSVAESRAWSFEHEPGPGRGRGPVTPFGQQTAAAAAAAAAAIATAAGVLSGGCLPVASPRVPSPFSPLRTPFSPLVTAVPTVGLPPAAGQSPFSSRSSGCSEVLGGLSFLSGSAGVPAQLSAPNKRCSVGTSSPSAAEPLPAGAANSTPPPPSLATWSMVGPLSGSMSSPISRANFFENAPASVSEGSLTQPQLSSVACASLEDYSHVSEPGSAPLLSCELTGVATAASSSLDEHSTLTSCSAVGITGLLFASSGDSPLPPTLERRSPACSRSGSPGSAAAAAAPPLLPLPVQLTEQPPGGEPLSPTPKHLQPPALPPLNGHASRVPTSWHRSEFWEEQLRERERWKREQLQKRRQRDVASLVGDGRDRPSRGLYGSGKEEGDVDGLTAMSSRRQLCKTSRASRGGSEGSSSSCEDSSSEGGDSSGEELAVKPGCFVDSAASANRSSTADAAERVDGSEGGRAVSRDDSIPSSAAVLRPPGPASIMGSCDLDAPSLTISIPLTLLRQCKPDGPSSGVCSRSDLLHVGVRKRSVTHETPSAGSGNDRLAVNGFRSSGAVGSSLPKKKFKAAPRRFKRDYVSDDALVAPPEAVSEKEGTSGDDLLEEKRAPRFHRDELLGLLPGGGCARSGGMALLRCSRYAQDELLLAHLRARACAMLLSLFPHLRVGGHFRPGTGDVDELVESVRRALDDSALRRQLKEDGLPERRGSGPSQLTVVPSQASQRRTLYVSLSARVKSDIERLQCSICGLLQLVLPHLTWADLQTDGVSTMCELIDRVTAENSPSLLPALGPPAASPSPS